VPTLQPSKSNPCPKQPGNLEADGGSASTAGNSAANVSHVAQGSVHAWDGLIGGTVACTYTCI
jgi:hypothetical protein